MIKCGLLRVRDRVSSLPKPVKDRFGSTSGNSLIEQKISAYPLKADICGLKGKT